MHRSMKIREVVQTQKKQWPSTPLQKWKNIYKRNYNVKHTELGANINCVQNRREKFMKRAGIVNVLKNEFEFNDVM